MKLAGIDLAWTEKNCSGIAFGKLTGNSLTVNHIDCGVFSPNSICSELKNRHIDGVAIDAPLVINNPTGMRECERSIGREFGSKKASCMPSNLSKYPNHPAVNLSEQLLNAGYNHLNIHSKWQVECYPHPAIITIFDLVERLKYKKKKGMRVADQQYGLHKLGKLLKALEISPVLQLHIPSKVALENFAFGSEDRLSGKALKNHEDKLDALVCLYVAGLHATQNTVTHGTIETGYIVTPKCQSYINVSSSEEPWHMAPWAVETAYNYYRAAIETWRVDGKVSMTNAALAIEILLKSFRLTPALNIGDANERYEWKRNSVAGHDLSALYDDLPSPLKDKLVASADLVTLNKYRNHFSQSRYSYEVNARVGYNDDLLKLANLMICRAVKVYLEHGCNDAFIKNFSV